MDKKSKAFLFEYLNNASPTGFESSGQQIWLDYLKPYVNDYIVDVYGTAVGVINPKANYKVVIEGHNIPMLPLVLSIIALLLVQYWIAFSRVTHDYLTAKIKA